MSSAQISLRPVTSAGLERVLPDSRRILSPVRRRDRALTGTTNRRDVLSSVGTVGGALLSQTIPLHNTSHSIHHPPKNEQKDLFLKTQESADPSRPFSSQVRSTVERTRAASDTPRNLTAPWSAARVLSSSGNGRVARNRAKETPREATAAAPLVSEGADRGRWHRAGTEDGALPATRYGRTVFPDTKHVTEPMEGTSLHASDQDRLSAALSTWKGESSRIPTSLLTMSREDKERKSRVQTSRWLRHAKNQERVAMSVWTDDQDRMRKEERHFRGLSQMRIRYLSAVADMEFSRSGMSGNPAK